MEHIVPRLFVPVPLPEPEVPEPEVLPDEADDPLEVILGAVMLVLLALTPSTPDCIKLTIPQIENITVNPITDHPSILLASSSPFASPLALFKINLTTA
jgi:hypothetical protein